MVILSERRCKCLWSSLATLASYQWPFTYGALHKRRHHFLRFLTLSPLRNYIYFKEKSSFGNPPPGPPPRLPIDDVFNIRSLLEIQVLMLLHLWSQLRLKDLIISLDDLNIYLSLMSILRYIEDDAKEMKQKSKNMLFLKNPQFLPNTLF